MRFFITLFICKIYYFFQKNKVSDRVGMLALRLDPKFLEKVAKPERNICITGTNGKTVTTTMICDCFNLAGNKTVTTYGTNLTPGIVKALISKTSIFNKSLVDVGVFECDENSMVRLLKTIKPQYLVLTNLSVDNLIRTGNIDFVYKDIKQALIENPDVSLITNGDDLICCQLIGEIKNKTVVYSIDPLDNEKQTRELLFKDVSICPRCQHELKYDFTRYFNIAKAHCPNCGYKNPESKYVVNKVDHDKETIQINKKDYKLLSHNIHHIYNQLCTYAVCQQYGLKDVKDYFQKLQLDTTRLWQPTYGKYNVKFRMCKGLNPVALSVNYNELASTDKKKNVIIFLDDADYRASKNVFEDTMYIYGADYEILKNESINQIIFAGQLCQHQKLRALVGGVDERKIYTCDKETDAHRLLDLDVTDIYVLFDRACYYQLKQWEKDLKRYLETVK